MKNWKSKQTSKATEMAQKESEYTVSQQWPAWKPKCPFFSSTPAVSPPCILPQAYLSGQGQSGEKKKALTLLDKKQKTSRVQLLWKKFNPSQASQVHSDN